MQQHLIGVLPFSRSTLLHPSTLPSPPFFPSSPLVPLNIYRLSMMCVYVCVRESEWLPAGYRLACPGAHRGLAECWWRWGGGLGWGGGVAPVTAVCHLCGSKWSCSGTPVKRIPLGYCLNQLGAGGGPQVVFDQHKRMLWRMSTVSLTANDHPQSAQTVGVYGKWLRERGLAEQRGETPLTRERDGRRMVLDVKLQRGKEHLELYQTEGVIVFRCSYLILLIEIQQYTLKSN